MDYLAPWWLPGGHLQTIWPALQGRRTADAVTYSRSRWITPDADFVDVDWLANYPTPKPPSTRPLLVLFHGLEGSSQSHYALALAAHARQLGWRYAVTHFRGCSGELNLAPRAYHSGDYAEVGWMLQRFRSEHVGPIVAVGVSLGGNALLRWAQESGESAGHQVSAIAAVCAPIDLAACGHALGRGINRLLYTPMFLKSMKPKALLKSAQFPGLFDPKRVEAAKTLYAFDDVFTAPLHGFKSASDYWQRASAKPHMHALRVPTLLVHAQNDPFVPAHCVPTQREVSKHVTLWQPRHGGHVGFAEGARNTTGPCLPPILAAWFQQHMV